MWFVIHAGDPLNVKAASYVCLSSFVLPDAYVYVYHPSAFRYPPDAGTVFQFPFVTVVIHDESG